MCIERNEPKTIDFDDPHAHTQVGMINSGAEICNGQDTIRKKDERIVKSQVQSKIKQLSLRTAVAYNIV